MSESRLHYLLERYFAQNCTAAEKEELAQLTADSNDDELKSSLQQLWFRYNAHTDLSATQSAKILTNIFSASKEKTAYTNIPTAPVHKLPIINWRWAAAAIVLMLCASTYLFVGQKDKTPIAATAPTKTINDAQPGKNGAILTLANGQTIVLDSLGNGVVANQNGAKVVLQNGQLAYQNGDKIITADSTPLLNTMTTPRGRQFQVILPDGTKVWLNAASSITYPVAFAGNERKVSITGEVYFEVTKNAQKPFRVKVNDATEIEVLGTHFNINAYKDENSINTTLLEGSIRLHNNTEKAILKPGQQAQVSQPFNTKPLPIQVLSDADVEKVMAWKNGVFDFQDATLEEVMRQLQRWYDIEVVYEKGVPKLEFIGKMGRDLSLTAVLNGLQMSKVHFRLEGGRKLIVLP